MPRDELRRYAAPAAFLLAVTIAVVLVRAGMHSGHGRTTATTAAPPAAQKIVDTKTSATTTTSTAPRKKEFWTVKAGDTFGVIAAKTGVPVATIAQLNPKISSTSLFIGEKVRVR